MVLISSGCTSLSDDAFLVLVSLCLIFTSGNSVNTCRVCARRNTTLPSFTSTSWALPCFAHSSTVLPSMIAARRDLEMMVDCKPDGRLPVATCPGNAPERSEEHTSELQSQFYLLYL